MLPHIAAGINLNFWPAGPIFRRLGAFFIRRTFKGNKLYSTDFREYLGKLHVDPFAKVFVVEALQIIEPPHALRKRNPIHLSLS